MISNFALKGWGSYRPQKKRFSLELDEEQGVTPGWTERQFGIGVRHVANENETTSFMAASAARKALDQAGWGEKLPDVIIGGCGVMEQPIPSTSALVQHHLGYGDTGIPGFDVNQTCLSFMTALDIAAMGIACGRWQRVLLFSSDIASVGLNPDEPKTRAIFGDGAAALAIEASDQPQGLCGTASVTHGAHHALAQLRAGGTKLRIQEGFEALKAGAYFEMDAFGIFKASAKTLPGVIEKALAQANITRDELACVVCHQASAPGVEHVRRLFAPRSERVIDLFATTGNQIAASIPTVLAHALTTGAVKAGDYLLLLGTAAGISASAMVLRV